MTIFQNNLQSQRTPESAFEGLKDYPFQSHYAQLGEVRMHYLDEGERDAPVIFLFHGQPSWSYLYRHMIPLLVQEGYRVIVPDLIGFGKSDKPIHQEMHTYSNHVQWVNELVRILGITHAKAFMQDWGGMIGLRVLADNPEWLDSLVLANTALSEVKGLEKFIFPRIMKWMGNKVSHPTLQRFQNKLDFPHWAGYFSKAPTLQIGEIMQVLTTRDLSVEEKKAYDAPFPDPTYYGGPRTMPQIIATDINDVNKAWDKLKKWEKPVLTLFSDKDPFLADKGYDKKFQKNFKGAKGQPHITVANASHFLQEDQPAFLVKRMLEWYKSI